MGQGTVEKIFRVLDRNSDDWNVFFFTFSWEMVRLNVGKAVNAIMAVMVFADNFKCVWEKQVFVKCHALH